MISILGDSISTLEGYNPTGYKVFHYGNNCERSGIKEMQHTWWGKVIEYFGGELLVNNSWSGSRVTRLPGSCDLFPSGCSDERTGGLHINGVKPDVIIIYMGTNDWGFGVKAVADKDAEIWCCTITRSYIFGKPDFEYIYSSAGIHMDVYNKIIRVASKNKRCKLVEIYNEQKRYDSLEGVHPVLRGMNEIAEMIVESVENTEKCKHTNGSMCL